MTLLLVQLVIDYAHADEVGKSPELSVFQAVTGGAISIKEGLFTRTIIKPDGTTRSVEHYRFGMAGVSWFLEPLDSDPTSSGNFLRSGRLPVIGATASHVWTISDSNIHIVAKEEISGSVPQIFQNMASGIFLRVVGMGIPMTLEKRVHWDQLHASGIHREFGDYPTNPTTDLSVTGTLQLGPDGKPRIMAVGSNGVFSGSAIEYEYSNAASFFPSLIRYKYSELNSPTYKINIISILTNDAKSIEFKPAMFGDMNVNRVVTVWSNSLSFMVKNGRLDPNVSGVARGSKALSLVLFAIAALVVFPAYLVLRWNWRKQTRIHKNQ